MNLSAPFIRRPIATSLLARRALAGRRRGIHAAAGRPAAQGRSRDDQRQRGAARREPDDDGDLGRDATRAPASRIAGVSELTSTSALGTTSITIQFGLDRDIEGAARDVQAAINAAGGDLPREPADAAELPQGESSDSPILILALRSKTLPLPKVFEAANTVLAQKISQVPGVGQVGRRRRRTARRAHPVQPALGRGDGALASRICATRSPRRPRISPRAASARPNGRRSASTTS